MITDEQQRQLNDIRRSLSDLVNEFPHRTAIRDTMGEFSHEVKQYMNGRLQFGLNEAIKFYAAKIAEYDKLRM
jgi:hypothetical protein